MAALIFALALWFPPFAKNARMGHPGLPAEFLATIPDQTTLSGGAPGALCSRSRERSESESGSSGCTHLATPGTICRSGHSNTAIHTHVGRVAELLAVLAELDEVPLRPPM